MAIKALRATSGEMEILAMFWAEGPLTLGEAHQVFSKYAREVSYPTMQTRLNRMVCKKLLSRNESRPFQYTAGVTRDQVSVGHLRELLTKISQGDVIPLVAHLLKEDALTSSQISELEQLLAQARTSSRKAT